MEAKFAYTVAMPDVHGKTLAWSGKPDVIFPKLSAMGYAGVELFVRDPVTLDPEKIRTLAEKSGLKVVAVGTGPLLADDKLSFTDPQRSVRKAAIARAQQVVDFASVLESQVNIGKLRGNIGPDPDKGWAWMEQGFQELCAYEAEKRTVVTLEPQHRFGCDNLNTTQSALAWVMSLNIPNLFLMLDVFHMQIDDVCMAASFIEACSMTLHVHFADNNRRIPGGGNIDFAMVLHVLRALEYDKYISLEINQIPDSETAAKKAVAYLHTLTAAMD